MEPGTPSATDGIGGIGRHADLLCCPACRRGIAEGNGELFCGECGSIFPVRDGVPRMAVEPGVAGYSAKIVRSFYDRHPFPGYAEGESPDSLIEKAERSLYAKWLKDQLPRGARVSVIGCGTGQLAAYLALGGHHELVAADLAVNPLCAGRRFALRWRIESLSFVQMDLFHPCLKPRAFDAVICQGVVHHTFSPRRAFERVAELARPGGYVVIGVYNTFGRMLTKTRRRLMAALRRPFPKGEFAASSAERRRKEAWVADQFHNPRETSHTFGEVLRWFDSKGIEVMRTIPSSVLFDALHPGVRIDVPSGRGSALERALVQAKMMLTGRNAGMFIVIGRKRAGS